MRLKYLLPTLILSCTALASCGGNPPPEQKLNISNKDVLSSEWKVGDDSRTLTYTSDPALQPSDVSLKVGDTSVVSVSGFVLTPVKAGTTTVELIYKEKSYDSLSLTVKANDPTPTGKVVIDFWHTFGQTVADAMQARADEFTQLVKQNENVDVEINLTYKGGYNEIKTQVTTALAAGDSPTIAVAYPDHVADYIAMENGQDGKYVVNMQDYIDDPALTFGTDTYLGDTQGIFDFDPTVIQEGTSYAKEGMFSLSVLRSTEVMFYNGSLAKAALPFFNDEVYSPAHGGQKLAEGELDGYLNSITFKELMDYSEVIMNHKVDLDITDDDFIPTLYDSDGNLFITALLQNGIPYSSINELTGLGQIDFETGEARELAEATISELKDYASNNLLATKGTLGEYSSNYFKQSKCVFSIGSSGGSGYQFPEEGSFDIGVTRIPSFNTLEPDFEYITQGVNLTLLTHPGHADADRQKLYGWKFLKYLTSTEANVKTCVDGSEGYMPVRKSSLTTNRWQQFLKYGGNYKLVANVITEQIDGKYLSTPAFKGSSSLRNYCGGIVTSAFLNKGEIKDLFDVAIKSAKTDMA